MSRPSATRRPRPSGRPRAIRASSSRRRTGCAPRPWPRSSGWCRGPRARAGLVAELEARQVDVTAAVDSADRDAAERLRAAIAAGADDLPLSRRVDAMQAEAAKAAGKLGVARTALAQLEGEQAEARTAAEGCDRAVRRAAIQVLIDEGAALADEIAALDAAAAEKRRQLDALAVELTSQTRSLDGSGNALRLPAKISRVLAGPPDQQLVTARSVAAAQPWAEQFAALVAEPGAA